MDEVGPYIRVDRDLLRRRLLGRDQAGRRHARGGKRQKRPPANHRVSPKIMAFGFVGGAERKRSPCYRALLVDLGLDEPRQVSQRFLPAEITGLQRYDIGQAFLNDVDLGADRYFL